MREDRPEILIVEDNDDDYEATFRALRRGGGVTARLERRRDGTEAWNDLDRRRAARVRLPDLILLDLNTPGMDGRMLLERIRCNRELRAIPVVVLTTSDNEVDIDTCYRNGANTYLRKSSSWPDFAAAIETLMAYWFTHAERPLEGRPQ